MQHEPHPPPRALYSSIPSGLADVLFAATNLATLGSFSGVDTYNMWEGDHHGKYDRRLFTFAPRIVDSLAELPPHAERTVAFSVGVDFVVANTGVPREQVRQRYVEIIRTFRPTALIERAIPPDVGRCVGVHLRKSDKVAASPRRYEGVMDVGQFETHLRRLRAHLRALVEVDRESLFYISADDAELGRDVAEYLKFLDPDVRIVKSQPPALEYENYRAVLDFFCLSRCKSVVQNAWWSGFSVAAALIGDKELVNFSDEMYGTPHFDQSLVRWAPPKSVI